MKILILHNRYQHRGGEDTVLDQEIELLKMAGHQVVVDVVDNAEIVTTQQKIKSFLSVTGSAQQYHRIAALCAKIRPDVVHIHNFFPTLTPSVHLAATESGAAVVQTLHNYRLLCASALLMRDNQPCEICLTKTRWHAVKNKCYRSSGLGSIAINRMIKATTLNRHWTTAVDRFIALTHFGKEKFIQGGLPASKIFVKPNFLSKPTPTPIPYSDRDIEFVFIGRLSAEKGIKTLISAWHDIPDHTLHVIGSGPEEDWVRTNAPANVVLHGALPHQDGQAIIRRAGAMIFPSVWYEGFPLTIIEALAHGVPVISSQIGAPEEVLKQNFSDFFFQPGNAADMVRAVERFTATDATALAQKARHISEELYSASRNLKLLEACYAEAIEQRQKRLHAASH